MQKLSKESNKKLGERERERKIKAFLSSYLHIILRAIWASTAIINIQSSMKFSQSLRCNMLMHLHLIGQDIINIKKFTT